MVHKNLCTEIWFEMLRTEKRSELDQFYYKNDGLLNDQNGSRVENWTRERV